MTETVTIEEAKNQIASLLDRVTNAADEIVIAEAGRPVARIVPVPHVLNGQRMPGGDEGKVWMADDFNAPLPDDALGG